MIYKRLCPIGIAVFCEGEVQILFKSDAEVFDPGEGPKDVFDSGPMSMRWVQCELRQALDGKRDIWMCSDGCIHERANKL